MLLIFVMWQNNDSLHRTGVKCQQFTGDINTGVFVRIIFPASMTWYETKIFCCRKCSPESRSVIFVTFQIETLWTGLQSSDALISENHLWLNFPRAWALMKQGRAFFFFFFPPFCSLKHKKKKKKQSSWLDHFKCLLQCLFLLIESLFYFLILQVESAQIRLLTYLSNIWPLYGGKMSTGISSVNATEKVPKTKKCINCSLHAKNWAKCSEKHYLT